MSGVSPAPVSRAGPAVAAALAALLSLVTGCQTLDDAGRVITRADLLTNLATRLERSVDLVYSAEYQLAGGRSGSIVQAQAPLRAAYTYPGGKLTISDSATIECTTGHRPTCVLNEPTTPGGRPAAGFLAGASRNGLVAPPVVVELLTSATLSPDATIEQTDTTVAGRHATCVAVRQVDAAVTGAFDVCVTTEGVLGSFTGVLDGHALDMTLTRYRDVVAQDAFDLPQGAGVVDRRSERP
jgi:hypothetical protein